MHQQPPSGRVVGPSETKSSMRETGDPAGLQEQVSHLDFSVCNDKYLSWSIVG